MIRLYKTPAFFKKLWPKYTWHREATEEKLLYLTFDDGPVPEATPWVLDQLEKYKAKATFFCVGDNVRKYPEITTQIQQQGHVLANHTYNHLNGWRAELNPYLENVAQCQQELEKYTLPGSKPLYRPPYGRITQNQARQLESKYEIIMWDVLTNDYDNSLSPEKCLRKSIQSTQNGSIIVFHDSLKARRNMMYALPRYLEHFTGLGYTFETL
ncbi:peptidoglycan/xylan/chitin deacetylase (PgdA/CDA1 family) [Pontibacter aydingkolensis]|uniref:Polysaccharide deacetylase family protein n=1 Tax=Pontibacter aydingkolensis TaxID=1911536 RepID=A0ABS7CVY7_9BACT|nr:polysaccharide deacetylase family protein [Pontibacter aydingkolensis]MBW7468019.1 polysaccharide deacetylase family protein [Pontibacter aydingkolensis]